MMSFLSLNPTQPKPNPKCLLLMRTGISYLSGCNQPNPTQPTQPTHQEVHFFIPVLTSLAAVRPNPARSTNAFNPNPTSCLMSNGRVSNMSWSKKIKMTKKTCWQLSSLPLQGQGRQRPRGPCDLTKENDTCHSLLIYYPPFIITIVIISTLILLLIIILITISTLISTLIIYVGPPVSIMASGTLLAREATITCKKSFSFSTYFNLDSA